MSDDTQPNVTPVPSEQTIFAAAMECATPLARANYLDSACGPDTALRERVEALLRAAECAGDFLEHSPTGLEADEASTRLVNFPSEHPGDRIGRYKLLQQIGEGGCGVVYMAEQEEPVRRRVALKIIKVGMDTKSVIARFEAERQALALMDHPNIAKVLDAGATEKGRPYFVMELIRGVKITDYCDQNHLPTEERLELFIQVCQAIQHAHQKGIIHRDIKPSNVLVTQNEQGAVPKVIDFGIAKATTDQRLTDKTVFTAFEQFIGTPAYMSPEQAMMTSLDIDTRTDIYALGVLLYELLIGQTPFDARTLMAAGLDVMRRIIREQEPERPSTRLSTLLSADLTTVASHRHSEPEQLGMLLRGDLDWIVMKCLEKDRARRYETASGLANDIQRHLTNEPVLARPPSATYRFQKMIRRNQLAVGAVATVLLALIFGVMVSGWLAVRATRAEKKAQDALAKAKLAQAAETQQKNLASQNAAAEKLQRVKAELEAKKARDVLDFIQNMFTTSGDSYADQMTVLAMLDRGAASIDQKFKDQPDVSASVQYAIGYCYSKVGHWETAEEYLQNSINLRVGLFGWINPDTLDSARELASVALSRGRSNQAIDLCKKIMASARTGYDLSEHSPIQQSRFRHLELWAIRKLCQTYIEAGNTSLARPLAEQLVNAAESKELSGIEGGNAWSELGTIALAEGRPDDALSAFDHETNYYSDFGPVQKAWTTGLRGSAYLALGDYQRAETLLTNSLPVLEHRFTDRHFRVQSAYRDLISLYSKSGRENEAETNRLKLARGLNDVAWVLATSPNPNSRNGSKAVQFAKEAVQDTHRNAPEPLRTLAAAYAENQQFDLAAATEREALALLADPDSKANCESRVKLYEQQQSYHEEIKPSGLPDKKPLQ